MSGFLKAIYLFASTTNLFKYLRKRYDYQLVHDLNQVITLKGKCVRNEEGISFLKKCLEYHVTPTNVRNRVRKAKPKRPVGIERAFIKDDIEKRKDFLEKVRGEYSGKLSRSLNKLSFLDRIRFAKLVNITSERLRRQNEMKNDKALQRLIKVQQGQGVLRHSTVFNLADIELTEIEKDVLCRGLNFGIPPRLVREEIEAEFELCWKQLERLPTTNERHAECKAAMANEAQKYLNAKVDKTGYSLNKEHLLTIKQLKKNKDIVITKPDKGNGVVILNRVDYIKKMEEVLSRDGKFELIGNVEDYDTTVQQERALQAFLLRAHKNGHLTKGEYERVRPVGSSRPRLYGVPKIHKPGAPLRPILSMVNAPQQELAKWLAEVLRPVVEKYSGHTIRDTFAFCEHIEQFPKENIQEMYMCSFDIVSLFTNIPLSETIQICLDSLYRDEEMKKPRMPEALLKKMLMKATTEVQFSFDGKMYRQNDGVAMGSPLGPVLANIFVGHCESKIDTDDWPDFYDRFVDDTFAIFPDIVQSEFFFTKLNSLHPQLRFTVEGEDNGELPFMDVLVKRHGEGLERAVYRKPTFTGQYTRWDSFAPTSQKIALIRSLTSRAMKICSPSKINTEVESLKKIFSDNGYPDYVVDRTIRKTMEVGSQLKILRTDEERKQNVMLRLPWIGTTSNAHRQEIERVILKGFPTAQPRIVFTTCKAFSGREKDVLPITSLSNVIYEFTCCCAQTYVGKTTQSLSERIKQHVPTKLLEKASVRKCCSDSAITRHLKDSPTCVNTKTRDNFRVIAKGRNQDHLGVLGAIFIRRRNPSLCQQKEHLHILALT